MKQERLFEAALKMQGREYAEKHFAQMKREAETEANSQTSENLDAEGVDSEGEIQYNKKWQKLKFKFQHQNFPPENERQSEAHRLAVWWARRSDIETGDQTLISMNDTWYLVEKFDDALNYYQVEDKISQSEFDAIFKEIKENGRSGKIESIQTTFDVYDQFHKSSDSFESGKSGVDSSETRHGEKNSTLVRMASSENNRRERSSSDGRGDSQSRGTNREGVKYFLKKKQVEALESRGVKGDALLDAIDLADEILAVNGEITDDSKAVLYHATSAENAKKIIATGKMYGKEDALFFSTKNDGEISGYGDTVIEAKIPLEKLTLNDVFSDEVHVTMSVKPYVMTNIRYSRKKAPDTEGTDGQKENAPEGAAIYDESGFFSEDKYFKSQMSTWNEKTHGTYINVGVIGEAHPIHKVGLPSGKLRYDVSKINKNMSDHAEYITTDLLKTIPSIIANPIAISEYSQENTISVFGNVFISSSPMMVGITISKDRAGNDINKVRTFNARKDVGSLITDESVLYLNENKKKTREWFQACGIQVPLGGNKFGFIRSIAQNSKSVNRENEEIKKSRKKAPDIITMSKGEAAKKIINKLTGEELDARTLEVLDKLEKGQNVPSEEIAGLKEVIEGKAQSGFITTFFLQKHQELANIPTAEIGTYLLNDEARRILREDILRSRLREGAYSGVDKNGEEVYNGSVKKEKRIDVVIGLPASGKSSSLVNPLSEFYHSVVVDSDIIKKKLPEFEEGWGSSLVHEESSMINYELLNETLKSGNNIVLPIVGSKVSSVETYIDLAKKYGYHVNLHLNELSNTKAIGRLLKRYFETGRFIDPTYVAEYGDKPIEVYEELKKRSIIDGYSRWNNDVPRGQRPQNKDGSVSNRAFIEYSASYGKIGRRDVEKNDSRGRNEEARAEQIKYSHKKAPAAGEVLRDIANVETLKVYERADAERIVNSVVGEVLNFESGEFAVQRINGIFAKAKIRTLCAYKRA